MTVDSLNVVRAAKLRIYDAGKMTPARRTELARWLREHARMIENQGHNYAPNFKARYLYPEDWK
jgi:phage antirepressor YoqD-like protein